MITRTFVATLALSVTLLASCDLVEAEFADVAKEVQTTKGLDINDPIQVLGASFFADEEQAEQLRTVKSVQRLRHEQKGDDLARQGKPGDARREYESALQWTGSKDTRNMRAITEKIGDVRLQEADRALSAYETGGQSDDLRRTIGHNASEAEKAYAELALTTRDSKEQSRLLAKQAVAAWYGGSSNACTLAREAARLDPTNRDAATLTTSGICQ